MVKVSAPADALYGLEDLLKVAGALLGEVISPRTVRLYATQGLIDRPGKDGRRAVYGHRHLLQLVLVRALARRGLSLSAIVPLCVLADADLEQQLEHAAIYSCMRECASTSAWSTAVGLIPGLIRVGC